MSVKRILITSAGRRNELIDLLAQQCQPFNVELILADASPDVPARFMDHTFTELPPTSSDSYWPALEQIIHTHNVNGLLSLTDPENHLLSKSSKKLTELGVIWLGSSHEAVTLCDDKSALLGLCKKHNIPHSKQWNPKTLYPPHKTWIQKPKHGSRSVGVRTINHISSEIMNHVPYSDIIVEQLQGVEYTVDVLSDDDALLQMVPRIRSKVRDGESVVGETQRHSVVESAVQNLFDLIDGLRGIWSVQGFLHEGVFSVTEINPRIAGGLPLSLQAGANMGDWLAAQVQEFPFDPSPWREGVKMFRYLQGRYEG